MRYTKMQVLNRVQWLNELTGENYRASKAYGGWDLYIETPTHGHSKGFLGFDARKSTQEFMEYLDGICMAICYCRNNNK